LTVIDLDTAAHGGQLPREWRDVPGVRDGTGVLAALAERAGQPWPVTYTVTTPSGGTHLYFTAPAGRLIRNSAGRIGPMIDVRASGGYVLAAGSVIRSGRYEVAISAPTAPLPGWLATLALPPQEPCRPAFRSDAMAPGITHARLRGVVERVLSSQPGNRNGPLFWAACRAGEMVAAGQVDQTTAERVLIGAALEAGLRGGEPEARRTVASGLRRGGAV
jgi:hypothetical protein